MMIVMLLLKKGAVKTYTSMSINGVIHPLSAKREKDDFLSRPPVSSMYEKEVILFFSILLYIVYIVQTQSMYCRE